MARLRERACASSKIQALLAHKKNDPSHHHTMAMANRNRSRYYGRAAALLAPLISLYIIVPAASTIPRSTASCGKQMINKHPPWNPSTQINHQGYLKQLFAVEEMEEYPLNNEVVIRQVPGDGDCLYVHVYIYILFFDLSVLIQN